MHNVCLGLVHLLVDEFVSLDGIAKGDQSSNTVRVVKNVLPRVNATMIAIAIVLSSQSSIIMYTMTN